MSFDAPPLSSNSSCSDAARRHFPVTCSRFADPALRPDMPVVKYYGNKAVGEFMKRRVFDPGRTLQWNELTRHATGAPLSAEADQSMT